MWNILKTRAQSRAFLMHLLGCLVIGLLLGYGQGGSNAQVMSSKSLRSSNFRRDDLYRKEESITVTTNGHVQSPRFPNAYPRNLLLSWKLLSAPYTRIILEFDGQFGLEDPENDVCRYDFVEVEDMSESSTIIWGRWCGQRVPGRFTSKSNTIKVTFKSDDYFVAKPGFRLYYSLLDDTPPFLTNWEAVTISMVGPVGLGAGVTELPFSAAALDQDISAFSTVEELLRHVSPDSWQQDLETLYHNTGQYRPRVFHQHDRKYKLDLDRLHEDVRRFSCTPRNFSVNLREELRATNAVFFPRCLLVQRCGGNCACGTDNWNTCTCSAGKTATKLHEVLKFSPGPASLRRRSRVRWDLAEIHLQHHERCDCVCDTRPPR